jgi:hypothetical protein
MNRFLRTGAMLLIALAVRVGAASPAPDYTQPGAWAAYPGRPSHADDTPSGVTVGSELSVPVFFIHPTTYLAPVMGNAPYDAGGEVGERVDDSVLKFQASVFNGCCSIYAPRYRQASLKAITTNSPAGYAAAELAYGDVKRAFLEFLRQNPDRPFVLASHSQGSIHGLRLLQEQIIGQPLQQRLVAAYLIGVALPQDLAQLGVPVCASAQASGCVITWNSVKRGREDRRRLQDSVIWWQGQYQAIAGRPLVCVNPLDWRADSAAPASANRGAIYSAGRSAPIPAPVPGLTGAECQEGLLGVEVILGERRHFTDPLTLVGIYHDFDYGLFYMNIRENVPQRVADWRAMHR